ncbi:MAG: cell envelope integrity protein TolA [Methylococcales bacterium]|nr:cell envelope integrity protein TolA [Methylococcales bacterium]
MNNFKKYGFTFTLAVAFHLGILAMFGISYFSEPEIAEVKPLPEIIQATVLDDVTIMEEAKRLKDNKKNKEIAQQEKQKKLEDNRKKEEKLLNKAKEKRIKEEKQAEKLEKKRQENELKEKKLATERKERAIKEKERLEQIKKDKVKAKAKAKKQQEEKERLDKERKEKKQKAEKKRKADLAAEQKAEAVRKEAARQKQEADAKAKADQDRKATISYSDAIRRKVINHWIKPPLATKGMNCLISVTLLPSGDVMSATVTRGSGDSVFDRSAENAVRKASPLPVPEERELFNRTFRSFNFNFTPE